jgi:hypothetical protein
MTIEYIFKSALFGNYMADATTYRIIGVLRGIVRRVRAKIEGKVVRSQVDNIDIELRKDELEIMDHEDEDLPRMAYFTILCKNMSDIPFEIEEMKLYVELNADRTPYRQPKKTYPAANIRSNAATITHNNLGQVTGSSTHLSRYEDDGNIGSYQVEFEIPAWMENVERFNLLGTITFQHGVTKDIKLETSSIK